MALTVFNHCALSSSNNFVFKLCYGYTVLLLIIFSAVVTCKLLFGNSFTCVTDDDSLSLSYLNVKCYNDGAYILPSKLVIQEDGLPTIDYSAQQFRKYLSYYPWVNLLFLVQAFNFYLPHLLWKSYESGHIQRLTDGLQKFFDKEEKRSLELSYLAKYVLVTQGKHKLYTSLYIFFEALNCAISLCQTLWLVHFFGVTGAPDFLPLTLETWSNYNNFYFPPEALCDISKFSASGFMMRSSTQCVMSLNQLYVKMFLFLRVWYIILTVLCGIVLLYRIALLITFFRVFVAKCTTPLAKRSVLEFLCRRMSYSDWFFLTRMQKMMTDVNFVQMLDKISVISQRKDASKEGGRLSLFEDVVRELNSPETTSAL